MPHVTHEPGGRAQRHAIRWPQLAAVGLFAGALALGPACDSVESPQTQQQAATMPTSEQSGAVQDTETTVSPRATMPGSQTGPAPAAGDPTSDGMAGGPAPMAGVGGATPPSEAPVAGDEGAAPEMVPETDDSMMMADAGTMMPATDATPDAGPVADAGVMVFDAGPQDAGPEYMAPEDAGHAGPPPCSGKPGAHRGRSAHTMMVSGLARRFIYYAPESLDPNVPAPVLMVAHGYYMNSEQMLEATGFREIAEREGFVLMFPDGQGERAEPGSVDPPWNVGEGVCPSNFFGFTPLAEGDDQAFIDAMLGFAAQDQCLDEEHVYMTGFSMGGYFSNHSGCTRSDLRAVAPHSGGSHAFTGCASETKPVMLLHFEQDALISYRCGTQARNRWLLRNGCQATAATTRMVNGGVCEYYQGCDEGAQVAMCTFQAPVATDELFLGHAWSGGYDGDDPNVAPYSIPETENASELIWEFFTTYAW